MLIRQEFEEFKDLQEFKEREPGARSQNSVVRRCWVGRKIVGDRPAGLKKSSRWPEGCGLWFHILIKILITEL